MLKISKLPKREGDLRYSLLMRIFLEILSKKKGDLRNFLPKKDTLRKFLPKSRKLERFSPNKDIFRYSLHKGIFLDILYKNDTT